MQVGTSMILLTSLSRDASCAGTIPACPEMALISSVPLLMAPPSSLLEFEQESLEFRCVGVRIGNRRRKHVRDRARHFPGVLLNAAIALMDGQSDLIDLLPIDRHGPDT